jgi:hypothetical protein
MDGELVATMIKKEKENVYLPCRRLKSRVWRS